MNLYKPSELASFLAGLDVRAKKSLSQNFLIDRNVLHKMLQAAAIEPGDLVVEIGPGPGALTEQLLARGAEVIAIEKDRAFAQALRRLDSGGRLQVHEGDALTFPWRLARRGKVVSNLPYHITTPLLVALIPMTHAFSSVTVMMQQEVAQRVTARKGTSSYGSITLFLQLYSTPSYAFTVPPTCFTPTPSVHSAVVSFALHDPPLQDPAPFFAITRTAFQHRRKMLRSSLKELYSPADIECALKSSGLNPFSRPEELGLEEFLTLYHYLQR
jgi:16S rRNA (adenine1518-N6/adenine1519-N6)-dimethyltransferase